MDWLMQTRLVSRYL